MTPDPEERSLRRQFARLLFVHLVRQTPTGELCNLVVRGLAQKATDYTQIFELTYEGKTLSDEQLNNAS